jgi:hypothetical protein
MAVFYSDYHTSTGLCKWQHEIDAMPTTTSVDGSDVMVYTASITGATIITD